MTTYRSTGWAVADAVRDIANLRQYFISRYGQPTYTYVWGGSMGGLVVKAQIARTPRAIFRLEGEFWTIAFGGDLGRLRDTSGLRYLAVLLHRPGCQVLATDLIRLAGRAAAAPPADTDLERARVRVTQAVRAAMRRLDVHLPSLVAHLRATLHTGVSCSYTPDARLPVEWEL